MNDLKWVLLKNAIVMICWTVLAIIFNKWWIAFFAVLFFSNLTTKTNHYKVCDRCGKRGPSGFDKEDAAIKAERYGWIHFTNPDEDICPECKNKI